MASVAHHLFTVQQYDQMIATGIVGEDDPVELIGGEIVRKMPVGRLHGAIVKRLNQLFVIRLSTVAVISVQDPIVLDDSEPEPDIAILKLREDFYAAVKPQARDALLVIEAADSSLEYDREIKLPYYARAGIAEFWIVNLSDSRIEVYRQPQTDGSYALRTEFVPGQSLSMLAFPDVPFSVSELLG